MASPYCSAGDLYQFGLPRGALPNPGRLAAFVDATANTITLNTHGFAQDDPVSFRAEAGGSLPAPLGEGLYYFAAPVTDDSFSVALTASGAVIDLLTEGTRTIVIAPLPIAAAISWASRVIDDMLPAHLVPLALPVAEIVRMTCAELAAGKLLSRTGAQSKSLSEIVDAANKRLSRWALGVPIRGENAPAPANLATSATVPYRDSRGWSQFGGIGGPPGPRWPRC